MNPLFLNIPFRIIFSCFAQNKRHVPILNLRYTLHIINKQANFRKKRKSKFKLCYIFTSSKPKPPQKCKGIKRGENNITYTCQDLISVAESCEPLLKAKI